MSVSIKFGQPTVPIFGLGRGKIKNTKKRIQMPKVIQQFFTKLRHGSEELDPYSLNSLLSKIKRGFKKTLDSFDFRLWRSGTFGFGLNKFIRFSGTFAVAILLAITALAVCPIIIKTNVAEGTMGTAKASTSTITISSGESADLNVSTVSSTGTFTAAADEDMATFTVATDNFTGYTLNITGSDDNGLLTNTEASASINSLAAATDASTFANGSADTYNNKWGYQANILNTSTSQYAPLMSGNYLPAPTTTATAINTTACANGSTSCPNSVDTYGLRLGARLDYTKPTGTYSNTFILTAVANDVAYTISYEDNTGDSSVTGSPINPAATTAGSVAGGTASSATLSSSTPTRTGYTFRAWCLGTATHTAGANSTCSGTEYSAGASFGIDQTIDNTDITLYALWNVTTYDLSITFAGTGVSSVAVRTASGASGGTLMGTVSTSGGSVSGLAYGVAYYLYPTFSSAELESWENTGTYGTLSSTSDNNPTFTMGAGNGAVTIKGKSSATGMQAFTKAMCQSQASSDGVQVTDSRDNNAYYVRYINNNCWMVQNLRYKGDTGSTSTSMIMKSATSNISTDQNLTIGDLTLGNDYNNARIHDSGNTTNGVWYNYAAASAGYVTNNQNSTVESTESVCPKNWRLPTRSEMSGITSSQSAFFNGGSAVTGGYYGGGNVNLPGYGYWWSSTPHPSDSDRRGNLLYNGSNLGTNMLARYFGFYVRCVRSS